MVVSARVRQIVYYLVIALAVAGFATGALTTDAVNEGVSKALELTAAIGGILAVLNLTPDASVE